MCNKRILMLMLIGCGLLASCRRWRKIGTNQALSAQKKMHKLPHDQKKSEQPHVHRLYYVVHINGIECRQCVLAALKAFAHVDGIADVACHGSSKDYENTWFTCALSVGSTVLPVTIMQHRLEEQDLTLKAIEGTFNGVVLENEKHVLQLSIAGLNAPVKIVGDALALQKIRVDSQQTADHQLRLSGTLDVVKNRLILA